MCTHIRSQPRAKLAIRLGRFFGWPCFAMWMLAITGCGSSKPAIEWTPLEELLTRLADKDPDMRSSAIHEIKQQGAKSCKAAQSQIINALKDPVVQVRLSAEEAITLCGEEAAGAIPRLIELLKDKDPQVREYAAKALPTLGPAAQKAVEPLQILERDSNAKVKNAATQALKQLANIQKFSKS